MPLSGDTILSRNDELAYPHSPHLRSIKQYICHQPLNSILRDGHFEFLAPTLVSILSHPQTTSSQKLIIFISPCYQVDNFLHTVIIQINL
jgi:hypothetical protein